MATVEARGLKKYYGEIAAVDGVDLATKDGEFLVLLGPSGCGKTTLLRMIAGFEAPSAGELLIGGEIVNDLPPRARKIAMVFQSYALYPHMTVFGNIAFPLKAQRMDRAAIRKKVDWAAALFGIGHLLDRKPRALSGGERQRLSIARALLKDPPILILDEATSALDAATEFRVLAALDEVMKNRTTFVIAHRLATIRKATKILVFDNGRIVETGTFEELHGLGGRFAQLTKMQFSPIGS